MPFNKTIAGDTPFDLALDSLDQATIRACVEGMSLSTHHSFKEVYQTIPLDKVVASNAKFIGQLLRNHGIVYDLPAIKVNNKDNKVPDWY